MGSVGVTGSGVGSTVVSGILFSSSTSTSGSWTSWWVWSTSPPSW